MSGSGQRMNRNQIIANKPEPNRRLDLALCRFEFGQPNKARFDASVHFGFLATQSWQAPGGVRLKIRAKTRF